MERGDRIQYAVEHTELIRPPEQRLATFGTTTIYYYLITEVAEGINAVREGNVFAERPRIVTPAYLVNVEGFSEQAREYIQMMAREQPHEPGVFYRYKNEPNEMNVVSGPVNEVIGKLSARIDKQRNPLSAIVKGVEELWDVSLITFMYHLTTSSLSANIADLHRMGRLEIDPYGVPKDARNHIDELFRQVGNNISRASELVVELNRWGLFQEYQDRFFALFRRG
jgi:hypothetical protein